MRVESCGPLLEPREGNVLFSNHHRFSEPIGIGLGIINPKNLFLAEETREAVLGVDSSASAEEDSGVAAVPVAFTGEEPRLFGSGSDAVAERPLAVGFFLTEEEWSLFKQPDGLELSGDSRMNLNNLSKSSASLNSPNYDIENWNKGLHPCPQSPTLQWVDEYSQNSTSRALEERKIGKDDESQEMNNNNSTSNSFLEAFMQRSRRASVVSASHSENESRNQTPSVPDGQEADTGHHYCGENTNPYTRAVMGDDPDLQQSLVSPEQTQTTDEEVETPTNLTALLLSEDPYSSQLLQWNVGSSISYRKYHHRVIPAVDTIDSHTMPIPSACLAPGRTHVHMHTSNCQHQLQDYGTGPWDDQSQPQSGYYPQEYSQQDQEYLQNWQHPQFLFAEDNEVEEVLSSDVHGPTISYPSKKVGYERQRNFLDDSRSRRQEEEVDTLNTFLSKFDDKVAAIWGHHHHADNSSGLGFAPTPYDAYLSTCSTPVTYNMYPWASPAPFSVDTSGLQLQYQIQAHSDYYLDEEPVPRPTASKDRDKDWGSQNSNESAATSKYLTDKEGYYIFKTTNSESSYEETESSLIQINHEEGASGFARFVPQLCEKLLQAPFPEPNPSTSNSKTPSRKSTSSKKAKAKLRKKEKEEAAKTKAMATEVEVLAMQEVFGGLELIEGDIDDSDSLGDLNLEVMAALKSHPLTSVQQQVPLVELPTLLRCWNTHFTPIEVIENSGKWVSPPGIINRNNPNLPEYTLFAGNEKEYNVFFRPAKTMFPVRFKLEYQNDKSVQTDGGVGAVYQSKQDFSSARHLSAAEWGWGRWDTSVPKDHHHHQQRLNQMALDCFKFSSVDQENNNNVNVMSDAAAGGGTDWLASDEFSYMASGGGGFVGGGGGGEYEYAGGGAHCDVSDYCCDSGIGIDGSSRAGFYDDYSEIGDYEYNDEGGLFNPYAAVENDGSDYGQLHAYSYNTWSTTSSDTTAGMTGAAKSGKGQRRKSKNKLCKYFLTEGLCKRGQACKFSHKIPTVCRYWAEGSCLKGDSCPYLHGFLEGKEFEDIERYQMEKQYVLNSENDFPTLQSNKMNPQLSSTGGKGSTDFSEYGVRYPGSGGGDAGSTVTTDQFFPVADAAGSSSSMYSNIGLNFAFAPELEISSRKKTEQKSHLSARMGIGVEGNGRKLHQQLGEDNGNLGSLSSWHRQGLMTGKGNTTTSTQNRNWLSSSMVPLKEKKKRKKH